MPLASCGDATQQGAERLAEGAVGGLTVMNAVGQASFTVAATPQP